ncbi:MAG: hypothetical protein PUJ55_00385 [Clostridiales bacterium]|nr:hypothetical protein [Roseburia sp.]MDD7635375.1 hypothetical protein [Clostridiales bacterium]
MKGLRTQENNNFIKFFEIVQNEAAKSGKVFFLDCEEGHDGSVDGMEVCNLSGWLIPTDKANEFEALWKNEEEDDKWSDFFGFVSWKDENGLKIVFE